MAKQDREGREWIDLSQPVPRRAPVEQAPLPGSQQRVVDGKAGAHPAGTVGITGRHLVEWKAAARELIVALAVGEIAAGWWRRGDGGAVVGVQHEPFRGPHGGVDGDAAAVRGDGAHPRRERRRRCEPLGGEPLGVRGKEDGVELPGADVDADEPLRRLCGGPRGSAAARQPRVQQAASPD